MRRASGLSVFLSEDGPPKGRAGDVHMQTNADKQRESGSPFISRLAAGITPYTAGEQLNDRKYVKLNTNENPYPPAPAVFEALKNFDAADLRLYPSPNADGLREKIAAAESVEKENVFCGNGSDEVLALCLPAFFDPDGKGTCFADITYSFYPVFCAFYSVPYTVVPLRADFSLDLQAFSTTDCQGYIIANPNAPTGMGIPKEDIFSFVAAQKDRLVIVDEAYMDFYGQSAAEGVKRYKNLLVVKTFSKSYSLAGIRCGYALGDKNLIDALFRVKDCFNSYPLDRVCQAVCVAAISSRGYYAECTQKVIAERTRLCAALRERGFTVPESSANFLFAGKEGTDGAAVYRALRERGVLVRHWNKPKISGYCRITVGTPEQNDALLRAIDEFLR